jgi:hypothetical protein
MYNKAVVISFLALFLFIGCERDINIVTVLKSAGSNRVELEMVLNNYRSRDINPDKLRAAEFLIENMPAHYSYAGEEIDQYYKYAAGVLAKKDLTPEQHRDSLLAITDLEYRDLPKHTVSDAHIIKASFLIDNIDKSYAQWKTCSWASHLSFEEYLEWLLPYKAAEFQEHDGWRDTLFSHFCGGLMNMVPNDVEYGTTIKVADIVRNETQWKINRHGLYGRAGLPLLSSHLLANQTYGNISDYTLTAVLTFRSVGIPAVIDETPVGSRGTAASCWFVLLSDYGSELPSEWDLSTVPGWGFFPYERGPKVFRRTYAINPDRLQYHRKAKYVYPFELARKDVTDKYFLTSDLELPIKKEVRKQLKDKYVYIASAVRRGTGASYESSLFGLEGWTIVDLGKIAKRQACFEKMGREVMYIALGYNGIGLIPITEPFILHKDGHLEFIDASMANQPQYDSYKNNPI